MQEHVLETTKQKAEQTSSVTSSPAIVLTGIWISKLFLVPWRRGGSVGCATATA